MNTLHLFAGIGGGIMADMMLGHNVVAVVEIDKYCRDVLMQRQKDGIFPDFDIFRDIRDFNGKKFQERVDMVCAGFPCQDISTAGKREGIYGKKSGLFFELARVCCDIRPEYIFMENVPAIISNGIDVVLGEISKIGYDAEWTCLSAQQLDAWHKRERWWMLCRKRSESDSTWQLQQKRIKQNKRKWVSDLRKTISDSASKLHEKQILSFGRKQMFTGSCLNNINTKQWWQTEPGLGRVADGVPNRNNRLKAIGNAQVPICAAVAQIILFKRFGINVFF